MYKEIIILETDFSDKYLIKHKEKTMFVGFIVKDIIEFLKLGLSYNEIHTSINKKYNLEIELHRINEIIIKQINPFITTRKYQTIKKIFKLFDPNTLYFPKSILKIFNPFFFYSSILIFSLLNLIIYKNYAFHLTTTFEEKIIIYIFLLFVLVLHELGHAISAKKYNINVKEIGFGMYYILPVFYVDLNEVWKLDRKKRILINLSGIYIQMILGLLFFSLSFLFESTKNILMSLFLVNFSIAVLNLNPFLKFDGYWIVSDLLNANNLNKTSNNLIKDILKIKKPNSDKLILFYSILKLVFFSWILFTIANSSYLSIEKIISNNNIDLFNLLPIIILCFIIYKLFNNFLNQNNETTDRKL